MLLTLLIHFSLIKFIDVLTNSLMGIVTVLFHWESCAPCWKVFLTQIFRHQLLMRSLNVPTLIAMGCWTFQSFWTWSRLMSWQSFIPNWTWWWGRQPSLPSLVANAMTLSLPDWRNINVALLQLSCLYSALLRYSIWNTNQSKSTTPNSKSDRRFHLLLHRHGRSRTQWACSFQISLDLWSVRKITQFKTQSNVNGLFYFFFRYRRYEAWRFFSYMLIHAGWAQCYYRTINQVSSCILKIVFFSLKQVYPHWYKHSRPGCSRHTAGNGAFLVESVDNLSRGSYGGFPW